MVLPGDYVAIIRFHPGKGSVPLLLYRLLLILQGVNLNFDAPKSKVYDDPASKNKQ